MALVDEHPGIVPVLVGVGARLHCAHRLEIGALELAVAYYRLHIHLDGIEPGPRDGVQQAADGLRRGIPVPPPVSRNGHDDLLLLLRRTRAKEQDSDNGQPTTGLLHFSHTAVCFYKNTKRLYMLQGEGSGLVFSGTIVTFVNNESVRL